jgi:hypothetical protein
MDRKEFKMPPSSDVPSAQTGQENDLMPCREMRWCNAQSNLENSENNKSQSFISDAVVGGGIATILCESSSASCGAGQRFSAKQASIRLPDSSTAESLCAGGESWGFLKFCRSERLHV